MEGDPHKNKKPTDDERHLHDSTRDSGREQQQATSDDDSSLDVMPSERPNEIDQAGVSDADDAAGDFGIDDALLDTGSGSQPTSEGPPPGVEPISDYYSTAVPGSETPDSESVQWSESSNEAPAVKPIDPLGGIEVTPATNLLGQPAQPEVIEAGGPDREPTILRLGDTDDRSPPVDAEAPRLSPRTEGLLSTTSDGGPPLARPIVLVSIPEPHVRRMLEEVAAEAGRRDAIALDAVAAEKVNHAFWMRDCEERALWGDF